MENFKRWSVDNAWVADLSDKRRPLPSSILSRYQNIPDAYMKFIENINHCHNADATTWFIICEGFTETDPDKWRYNEFELISLEAAADDSEWQRDITAFWTVHLPIILSVRDGYSYYAISIVDGSIVRGFEPEFEETETVAASFEEFLEKIISRKIVLL